MRLFIGKNTNKKGTEDEKGMYARSVLVYWILAGTEQFVLDRINLHRQIDLKPYFECHSFVFTSIFPSKFDRKNRMIKYLFKKKKNKRIEKENDFDLVALTISEANLINFHFFSKKRDDKWLNCRLYLNVIC